MKDIITEEKYSEILKLQEKINIELRDFFEENKDEGREHLASTLVNKVEEIVNALNSEGYNFGRCDFNGDINYENSEQTFSNGVTMGVGVILHFHGFTVQVSWEGRDKYA